MNDDGDGKGRRVVAVMEIKQGKQPCVQIILVEFEI